jgi:hypothetical protein
MSTDDSLVEESTPVSGPAFDHLQVTRRPADHGQRLDISGAACRPPVQPYPASVFTPANLEIRPNFVLDCPGDSELIRIETAALLQPGSAETPRRGEQVDSFEKAGLSRSVGPDQ